MPHGDTGSTAGVTAAALVFVGDAQVMAARPVSQDLLGTLEYNANLRYAVPLLCDIAAAAVRLVEDPYWWLASDEYEYRCNVCGGTGLKPVRITHDPDCPAMQLDAAIRAAGEAGHV